MVSTSYRGLDSNFLNGLAGAIPPCNYVDWSPGQRQDALHIRGTDVLPLLTALGVWLEGSPTSNVLCSLASAFTCGHNCAHHAEQPYLTVHPLTLSVQFPFSQ